MPLDTMAVLLALGLLAASLAGAQLPRSSNRGTLRAGTPDDGPLGIGAGRSARCPVCARPALELVGVRVGVAGDLPQVRCGACLSRYTVRGTLECLPQQRRPA